MFGRIFTGSLDFIHYMQKFTVRIFYNEFPLYLIIYREGYILGICNLVEGHVSLLSAKHLKISVSQLCISSVRFILWDSWRD